MTDASPGPLFRILGPIEVGAPGAVVTIPTGRQQVVLASLLLDANRIVGIEQLVDTLWGDEPPDTARIQVQICVSRLRKALSGPGLPADVVSRPPGYMLQVDEEIIDLHLFLRQLGRARVLVKEGRAAEAAESLRRAAGLWRGPSLSGITRPNLRNRAIHLDEERLVAVETYLGLELDLGRHRQLVGELGRLVDENPLREQLRGQLMLALYRSGRQSEALAVHRAGRVLLMEELGLEPGDALRLLETAILHNDPALNLPGTPEPPPVETAAEPEVAAPRPLGQERPRQLPADTPDYVGSGLVRRVEALLTDSRARSGPVVVIAGRPGTGKSALATHVAHRIAAEHYRDGQLYCDLRGAALEPLDPAPVLGRFLRALGIPGSLIPDPVDERAEMYRTLLADRRVLIVLDDAASERQIGPLLPGAGVSAVVVTSRNRLTALPGAARLQLDALAPAEALELLARVVGRDRVDREREAALALVRTVGGLPLALRIVAARLAARPHWTLASMVHRLANERHRLDELAHGELTIRATLGLTYDGLQPADRRLLRLLSLVPGPTVPGWLAGALLDDRRPEPADLLEPLVDVQLLDVTSVEPTGEFRYRFHEIIQLFVRERLDEHEDTLERADAEIRMLGGWLALAEQAHRAVYGGDYTVLHGHAPRWQPPREYQKALLADPLDWLDREQAGLCGAVDQAARSRLDELCWDLATTLVTLFESRGYHDLWERTHDTALEAVRRAGNRRGTAAVLTSLGTLYLSRGQPERSADALRGALDTFLDLDDRHGQGLCRRDLALLSRRAGDDDAALALYATSLRDFDHVGDVVGKAGVLIQSADIWMRRDEMGTVSAQLDEALAIYREIGYVGGEARTVRRTGQMLCRRGEHARALHRFAEALEMVRGIGDVIGEGHLLRDLGETNAHLGRTGPAREYFSQALAIRERIMDRAGTEAVRRELSRL
ncbi:BTAD domain-containing putative transcriptional regulator [Actinoplanes sp. NPDC051851]|uniref:AfsR/SARP family transcriptional regulator n=1 Tax=Actinoplanes sp. NPDC051851 TaxID=3154753 RepID=UPI003432D65B